MDRFSVQRFFNSWIETVFKKKPDMQKFLLNHERKTLAIDKCCEQVRLYEWQTMSPKRLTVHEIIATSARLFCSMALKQKEQQLLSKNEKLRLREQNELPTDVAQDKYRDHILDLNNPEDKARWDDFLKPRVAVPDHNMESDHEGSLRQSSSDDESLGSQATSKK